MPARDPVVAGQPQPQPLTNRRDRLLHSRVGERTHLISALIHDMTAVALKIGDLKARRSITTIHPIAAWHPWLRVTVGETQSHSRSGLDGRSASYIDLAVVVAMAPVRVVQVALGEIVGVVLRGESGHGRSWGREDGRGRSG